MSSVAKRGNSRVFSIKYGAGPGRTPVYHGWAMAGALSVSLGDVTRIEAPSPLQYGKYDVVDETRGAQENATLPITLIYPRDKSEVLALARARCSLDIQVHIGACQSPTDFDFGWTDGKVIVFENAHITTYNTTELGALESGDDSKVDEEIEISALEFYEVLPQVFTSRAADEVEQEIIAISVCDTPSCGDCDDPSDGCQKVFALSAPAGSSPGKLPEVVFTNDGFVSDFRQVAVNTLAIGEDPDDAACVGDYYVIVSNAGAGVEYATITDMFNAVANPFTENTGGIVASKEPNAISSVSPRHTWIVGDGGYVYFADDPIKTLVVQDAGVATTQNLNDVYAFNTQVVVAVGESNAVIYTLNGSTWQAVTGPDTVGTPGLDAVALRSEDEWWVGTDDGKVYYTTDKGQNWTEHTGITGYSAITDIDWATSVVGSVVGTIASGAGVVWRTISGGNTWYISPEGPETLTTNLGLNALAFCQDDANTIFLGGEGAVAGDGIIIKGTA